MTGELLKHAALLMLTLVVLALLSVILSRALGRVVHREWAFYLVLAPGTIVHELCHLLACLVTLVPVHEVHLFRVRREEDGTAQLGEVVHGDAGPVRNAVIGVAPLLGISAAIYFAARWLLPEGGSWNSLLTSGWTYLFLLLAFLLALGLSPSVQDLKSLPAFVVVATAIGVAGYYLGRELAAEQDIASFSERAVSSIKVVNSGLLLVVVSVSVACVITVLAWMIARSDR